MTPIEESDLIRRFGEMLDASPVINAETLLCREVLGRLQHYHTRATTTPEGLSLKRAILNAVRDDVTLDFDHRNGEVIIRGRRVGSWNTVTEAYRHGFSAPMVLHVYRVHQRLRERRGGFTERDYRDGPYWGMPQFGMHNWRDPDSDRPAPSADEDAARGRLIGISRYDRAVLHPSGINLEIDTGNSEGSRE